MTMVKDLFARLWNDEEGQTMVEYGLLVALIAVVLITVLINLGDGLNTTFEDIVNALP